MTPAAAIRAAFGELKADEGVVVVHAAALLTMSEGLARPATFNLRGRARKAIRSVAMLNGDAVALDVAKIRAPEKFFAALLKDYDEAQAAQADAVDLAAKQKAAEAAETKRHLERHAAAQAAAQRAAEDGATAKADATAKKNAQRDAEAKQKAKDAKQSPITPKKQTTPAERAARHGKAVAAPKPPEPAQTPTEPEPATPEPAPKPKRKTKPAAE